MNAPIHWVERAAVLAIALTTASVVLVGFSEASSPGRVALARYTAALDRDLRFIRATVRGSQVFMVQCVALAVCAAATALGEWTGLLLVPFVTFAPHVLVGTRAEGRVARLEEQIEPWFNAIANALKASPSLGEAVASSIPLVAAPMSEEVDVLLKEYELGTPLDGALDNLAVRTRGKTLAGAVLALKVARRSGGNLTEMLETTAAALRELARLEAVVRAKTAEGKAQAVVIGAIPVPMVLCIHWSDPNYFEPLAATFLGNLIVAGAATLWALAILASGKILSVDV